MMALTIVMTAAMILIVGLAIREVVYYLRERTANGLRQLTLRLSMAFMLLFLFGSVLVGVRYFQLENPDAYPLHWFAFWSCILMLTGALFCLVLADLRMLREANRDDAGRLWREIAETIARYELHRKD